jgi:glucan phosphoethanolaminetransferase (alkaline phosphatase superfamily)
VACASITFAVTTLATAAQLHPLGSSLFVGTMIEGIVAIVLIAFWTAIVAINTDAGDALVGSGTASGAALNANLYYFSWAGFITAILIFVSFLHDAFGINVLDQVRKQALRLQYWAAFFACSIVVMGSASRTLRSDCRVFETNDENIGPYCRKTRFAIASGTLGAILALLVIFSKVVKYSSISGSTPFVVEIGSAAFMTVITAFAVASTTSASGPGSQIGNMYYFSWASFLLSAVLVADCYNEYKTGPATNSNDDEAMNGTRPDSGRSGDVVMVETFDDAL